MKHILVILAIGLMIATAFSGCTGGKDNTGGTGDTGTGGGTGNETGNETGGNATGNQTTIPENYHQEHSDTLGYDDLSWTAHAFPVQAGAKKIIVQIKPTFTVPASAPGMGFVGGMDVRISDSKGNMLVDDIVNAEITYEFAQDEITKFGKWKLELFPEDPSIEVQSIIDVFYS